jgi:type IV pilus assembly protein PilW
VRGVERLNFRYGIMDANGTMQFLTANEVDTGTTSDGTTIPCPPGVSIDGGMGNAGCLWRAVTTIQVNVLMDGQTPLYTLTPAEMNYIYSPDGDNVPAAPDDHDIKPVDDQGFPKQLLRREFTTVVALRNYNP